MKAPKLNLVVLALFVAASAHAQTSYYRVNNNAGITGVHENDLTAALTLGSSDPAPEVVLIVEGSDTKYDAGVTIIVDFPVTIYGTGYFLAENPQTQADPRDSEIGNIVFNAGAAGSKMYGIRAQNITVNADDITISKCYVTDSDPALDCGILVNGDDATISKNFIEGENSISVLRLNGATNATVINNFVHNTDPLGSTNMRMTGGSTGVVLYNSFWGGIDNVFSNAVVEGNFFLGSEFSDVSSSNLTVNANADTSGFLALSYAGPPHETGVYPDSVFCIAALPPESSDGQYQTNLSLWDEPGGNPNPFYDYVNMVTNFGMYGGADPYLLSGMPRIPSVYMYTGSGSGTTGSGTGSTVKTKTHK